MIETAELPLTLPAPKISADEVASLVNVLRAAEGWLTAQEIAEKLGRKPTFERKVRAIASVAAPQVVSFPGSPGYTLLSRCTLEQINHCIDAFESQGRDMYKRALLYRRAYHSRAAEARSVQAEVTGVLVAAP